MLRPISIIKSFQKIPLNLNEFVSMICNIYHGYKLILFYWIFFQTSKYTDGSREAETCQQLNMKKHFIKTGKIYREHIVWKEFHLFLIETVLKMSCSWIFFTRINDLVLVFISFSSSFVCLFFLIGVNVCNLLKFYKTFD